MLYENSNYYPKPNPSRGNFALPRVGAKAQASRNYDSAFEARACLVASDRRLESLRFLAPARQ